jgi:hypothetical protein
MTSHSCLANNTPHMIKHDLNIMQIPSMLHSHDEACSTPHTIYQQLENENLLSYNLIWGNNILKCNHNNSWTSIQGCYHMATTCTMLESNNQVTNVGRTQL